MIMRHKYHPELVSGSQEMLKQISFVALVDACDQRDGPGSMKYRNKFGMTIVKVQRSEKNFILLLIAGFILPNSN